MLEAGPTCATNPLYCNWVVYYNDQAQPWEFGPFDPVVLDADWHPDLAPILSMGKQVHGYVSMGEVGVWRYYFDDVQNAGILISENPNWPGSWYVDIRDPFWTDLMINTVVPNMLAQGFNAIFIDTLDVPIYLEQINPSAYAGMIQAAIDLVAAVRANFPGVPIMVNRAYQILNDIGGNIDIALGESVYTTFNFATQTYEPVSQAGYDWQRTLLQNAQALHPQLLIFSLDYWDMTQSNQVRKIYKEERRNGFRPYVSEIYLNQIYPEP